MTPFEKLVAAFPVFTVKNKLAISKNIPLQNNEELVVPPYGIANVESKLLISVPSITYFKCISPSTSDLVNYGLLKSKKPINSNTIVEKAVEEFHSSVASLPDALEGMKEPNVTKTESKSDPVSTNNDTADVNDDLEKEVFSESFSYKKKK